MSAPYIIPFNFQPIATGTVLNGSYTVPSGKYARVLINCHAMARISAATADGTIALSSNADSVVAEFWLKAGDAITTVATGATGGPSFSVHSFSQSTASINGVQCLIALAPVSGTNDGTVPGNTLTISGSAGVSIRYEEFNQIS